MPWGVKRVSLGYQKYDFKHAMFEITSWISSKDIGTKLESIWSQDGKSLRINLGLVSV